MLPADPCFQKLHGRLVAEGRMLQFFIVKQHIASKKVLYFIFEAKLLNQISVGALSQQFPFRLIIEQVMPYSLRKR